MCTCNLKCLDRHVILSFLLEIYPLYGSLGSSSESSEGCKCLQKEVEERITVYMCDKYFDLTCEFDTHLVKILPIN